jgi:hypothetical protein
MEMKTGMLIDFGLAQVNKNNTNKYKNPFL